MSPAARTPMSPRSTMQLGPYTFAYIEPLTPARDASGLVLEVSPQGAYEGAATVPLHRYGQGSFCKFRISVPKGLVGVYAFVVDGSVHYIGECADLGKRFNMGYGNISPRNCYNGEQPTNCKINRWVLDMTKTDRCVDLYFHPTLERHLVETQLIARYLPPLNGRRGRVIV